jgi:hypothetical protein
MTLDEVCSMTLDQICDGTVPAADEVLKSAGGNYYPPNTDGEGTPNAEAVSTLAHFGVGNATAGTMPPPPTANAIADAVLARGAENVESTAGDHSLCFVILALAHADTTTHDGKLTVFKTTGDEFVQKSLATEAGAEPITGIQ